MRVTPKSDTHLEIAHVLFIDVVGYSKLLVNEQRAVIEELNQVVRKTPQVRKSDVTGKLIRIPAGDGMALLSIQTMPRSKWFGLASTFDAPEFLAIASGIEAALA